MKGINNGKCMIIIIKVKYSIVKIVIFVEYYYLKKFGISFNLVILEGVIFRKLK